MNRVLILLLALFLPQVALPSPFAVFNHKIFFVPGEGPVVETYLDFHGKSVVMSSSADGYIHGTVETTIIFRKGDNVMAYDKKVLQTPFMTPGNIVDFLDIQRFSVPPGTYTVELHLNDLNDPEWGRLEFEVEIVVPEPAKGPFFSDIELVAAFKKTDTPNIYSKSGYDLLPMVSDDYAGIDLKELVLYFELYNTDQLGKDEKFLLTTYLAHMETDEIIAETQRFERRTAATVVPSLTKINIADLESGDYTIVLEARDKSNEVLARKEHYFTRNHRGKVFDVKSITAEVVRSGWVGLYNNKAELYEYIRSTYPICDEAERFSLETTFDNPISVELYQMQQYFMAFWEKREPGNSEQAWLTYREKVEFTQKEFGTRNKRGYETDRGRVYLQYGPPVDITDRANEPSSYPYQIWRYYKAGRWNNVRFVFFDPDLTGIDYTLLHCERIPGETRNPQWRLMLEQRNTPMNDVDRRQGTQHFGGRVDDFFENPR